jgi:hypothetical protein
MQFICEECFFFLSENGAQWSELIQQQTHLAATGVAPLLEISSVVQAGFASVSLAAFLVHHAENR